MITKYERTIVCSNVCSSVQDQGIKFWLQSQDIGSDTVRFGHKGKHHDTQKKFQRLSRWYEERLKKSKI